jgi:hypothetical protein
MNRETTPLPGLALDEVERKRVREQFIAKFVRSNERHLPFWFSLPYWPIARDVFQSYEFCQLPDLYFMIGNGTRIHRASGRAIAAFFASQKPWEGFMYYVFDDSLDWCLASTDELIWDYGHDADFLVVKGGKLPVPHLELREPAGRDHYPKI